MAISKRTRYEVLRRDSYTCRYCRSTDNPLAVDHVTPVSLGGTDAPENLVACCRDCNAGKSSSSPDADTVTDVSEDAVRWAAAMQEAARERETTRGEDMEWLGEFYDYWNAATAHANLPADWDTTVRKFRASGVSIGEMEDAANLALARISPYSKNHFRYFCGICWNIVRELTARAEQIVREQDGG